MRVFLIFFLGSITAMSVVGQISIGTPVPHPSAQLDVSSTTKGLLPPRLTLEQRTAINKPADGLVIYCTDCTPKGLYSYDGATWNALVNKGNTSGDMQYWEGTKWVMIPAGVSGQVLKLSSSNIPVWSYAIGSRGPAGGIIFYDKGENTNGWRYLEAAPFDQGSGTEWGCIGTDIPGASGNSVGTGQANTTAIVNSCSTVGIAARLCDDLVLNGFSDWFLPSIAELGKMYRNKIIIGGFETFPFFPKYWSSSNLNSESVWARTFSIENESYLGNGSPQFCPKDLGGVVRAIRAF